MEATELQRRQLQRLALSSLGLRPDFHRGFVGEVQSAGLEAEILALPFAGEGVTLQDGDGNLLFMADLSAIDGADVIA